VRPVWINKPSATRVSRRLEPTILREPRAASLIMRRSLASGATVLLVRTDEASEWLEVYRAERGESAKLAEIDRLQRVYQNPLVRDVFIEMQGIQP
jgi:hypothetical protein